MWKYLYILLYSVLLAPEKHRVATAQRALARHPMLRDWEQGWCSDRPAREAPCPEWTLGGYLHPFQGSFMQPRWHETSSGKLMPVLHQCNSSETEEPGSCMLVPALVRSCKLEPVQTCWGDRISSPHLKRLFLLLLGRIPFVVVARPWGLLLQYEPRQ